VCSLQTGSPILTLGSTDHVGDIPVTPQYRRSASGKPKKREGALAFAMPMDVQPHRDVTSLKHSAQGKLRQYTCYHGQSAKGFRWSLLKSVQRTGYVHWSQDTADLITMKLSRRPMTDLVSKNLTRLYGYDLSSAQQ
jgi:hypothetical protein